MFRLAASEMQHVPSRRAVIWAPIVLAIATAARGDDTDKAARRPVVPMSCVDEICARWDKPTSPGMVLAVIRDGAIVYQRGYGMANLELDVPLSLDSVFCVGSTSKQFTAASIAILARQGKISLDDDVRKLIPELPDYGKPITIRHLMHHTSGLRDYGSLMIIAGKGEHEFTLDEVMRIIVRQTELNAPPGQEFSYTNSGYTLMAEIVKRASKKSLRRFADEHIFRPLGMTHTLFRDDNRQIIKHRAVGHESLEVSFKTNDPTTRAVGPSNLWTTVGDLFLWDQNFYHNKLGDGLVEELLTPGKLDNGHKLDYAYGLFVDQYHGVRRVHHGGLFAGFRTQFVRFPDERLSVICLSNLDTLDPHGLAMQVADLYLGQRIGKSSADLERPKCVLASEALSALAGTYRNPRTGEITTFQVDKDGLWLAREGPRRTKVYPQSESKFCGTGPAEGLLCEFLPQNGEVGRCVRIGYAGQVPRTLEAVTLVTPTAEQIAEYAGTFYSPEAEATFKLIASKDRLQLESPDEPRKSLQPGIRDEFRSPQGVLQFERDTAGKVTSFRLNAVRVLRLKFKRQEDS